MANVENSAGRLILIATRSQPDVHLSRGRRADFGCIDLVVWKLRRLPLAILFEKEIKYQMLSREFIHLYMVQTIPRIVKGLRRYMTVVVVVVVYDVADEIRATGEEEDDDDDNINHQGVLIGCPIE